MKKFYWVVFVLIAMSIFPLAGFAQWVKMNNSMKKVNYVLTYESNVVAFSHEGMFVSPNEGSMWVQVNSDTTKDSVLTVLTPFIAGYMASLPIDSSLIDSVRLSFDQGISSVSIDSLSSNLPYLQSYVDSMAEAHSDVVDSLQISINEGKYWLSTHSLPKDIKIFSVAFFRSVLLIGTNQGMYVTNEEGSIWITFNNGLTDMNVHAIAIADDRIYAGTEAGVFYCSPTSDTSSWKPLNSGLTNLYVTSLYCRDEQTVFAGTLGGGVFYSRVNTLSPWVSRNGGLSDLHITSLAVSENYVYVGTQSNGVWRRPLGEVTSVAGNTNTTPAKFQLSQNYPNPFNPATSMEFTVASSGKAVVKVFNLLGQTVATIFNGEVHAGVATRVTFNASSLPSGIYFARLESGGQVQIRKMVLTK